LIVAIQIEPDASPVLHSSDKPHTTDCQSAAKLDSVQAGSDSDQDFRLAIKTIQEKRLVREPTYTW